MKHEKSTIEIIQLGAPHGVLDLGNTLRIYQDVVRSEIDLRAKNVLWYENAGGHTRAEAENLSQDISKRNSVMDAEAAAGIRKTSADHSQLERAIDGSALKVLLSSPDAEHQHNAFSHIFTDWVLSSSRTPISVFPESYSSELQRENVLKLAIEATRPMHVETNSLDGIIAAVNERGVMLEDGVSERDVEIASFLEQKAVALAATHTRVKILVLVGSEHPGIQPAMSEAFLDRIDYQTRNFGPPVEGPEIDTEFKDPGFNREKAARTLCAKIISGQMKRIFLEQYKDVLLKEPARAAKGQTVFDHSLQICQSAPLEAIHLFLQKIARIDCGLQEKDCAGLAAPDLLNPHFCSMLLTFPTNSPHEIWSGNFLPTCLRK